MVFFSSSVFLYRGVGMGRLWSRRILLADVGVFCVRGSVPAAADTGGVKHRAEGARSVQGYGSRDVEEWEGVREGRSVVCGNRMCDRIGGSFFSIFSLIFFMLR
jgi:hypothetical protein